MERHADERAHAEREVADGGLDLPQHQMLGGRENLVGLTEAVLGDALRAPQRVAEHVVGGEERRAGEHRHAAAGGEVRRDRAVGLDVVECYRGGIAQLAQARRERGVSANGSVR